MRIIRGWIAYHLFMVIPGPHARGWFISKPLWWALLPYVGDWAFKGMDGKVRER